MSTKKNYTSTQVLEILAEYYDAKKNKADLRSCDHRFGITPELIARRIKASQRERAAGIALWQLAQFASELLQLEESQAELFNDDFFPIQKDGEE